LLCLLAIFSRGLTLLLPLFPLLLTLILLGLVVLTALVTTAAAPLSTSEAGCGQKRGRERCGNREPFYKTSLHSKYPFN
jgi:hypothetical protein